MKETVPLITEFWRDLPLTDHRQAGVPACLGDFKFLGGLLREKNHSYCHPIKHVLFACWLTDGTAKKLFVEKRPENLPYKQQHCVDNMCEDQILKLLKGGLSLNKVEQLTGRSRCFIKRVAELNRVAHQSNSSAYPEKVRRTVLIKAFFGKHRANIARELNVGCGYVEQAISSEPNMVSWRKHLKIRQNVLRAYRQLAVLSQTYPDWPRTKIRKLAQKEYHYLYNHDKGIA